MSIISARAALVLIVGEGGASLASVCGSPDN